MGGSHPGPQGSGPCTSGTIDSGTMARTTSCAPGVVVGGSLGKQRASWVRKVGDPPSTGNGTDIKLGEIFFPTAEDGLDADDEQVLNGLCADLLARLAEGYRFDVHCRGSTDHRGPDSYNFMLGQRRARSVKNYVETVVRDGGLRVFCESEGEVSAAQPTPGSKHLPPLGMEFERRVDIFFGAIRPPVRIGMSGNWIQTRSLEKLELNSGGHVYGGNRVTVMIRTDYRLAGNEGARKARIQCTVVRVDTQVVLFAASTTIDAERIIRRKGYKATPTTRVTRVILPGSEAPPPGARIVDVEDRELTDQCGSQVSSIYDQLRGSYSNITERVQHELEASRSTPQQ